MKLNVRTWGDGPKQAVLIHGFNCDSGDWWEVAPRLAERGYTVNALDLRGHGLSERADSYTAADYASDVIETIETPIDLLMGHSLGGMVAGLTAHDLAPARAIYLDPPWGRSSDADREGLFPDLSSITAMSDDELAATLRSDFPRWSETAVEVDVASWRRWDPRTADYIAGAAAEDSMPSSAETPSLLIVSDPSPVCGLEAQELARKRGFEVRIGTGLTHSLFRDDFPFFMTLIDDWF